MLRLFKAEYKYMKETHAVLLLKIKRGLVFLQIDKSCADEGQDTTTTKKQATKQRPSVWLAARTVLTNTFRLLNQPTSSCVHTVAIFLS